MALTLSSPIKMSTVRTDGNVDISTLHVYENEVSGTISNQTMYLRAMLFYLEVWKISNRIPPP